MDKLSKFDRSRGGFAAALVLMYGVMLALNHWTPYLVDDFAYMFRWDNGARLQSVTELIPSMKAHAVSMNGRLLAHGLEQLFLLLPKTVFDFVNAGVFVYTLLTLCRICLGERPRSSLLLAVLFAAVWLFLPVFGQVCLWQVGALNYLWALAFGLSFLRPFLREYQSDGARTAVWKIPLCTLLAFLAGGYTEITSLIVLLMAAALTVLLCVRRRSPKTWLYLPLLAAALGYWLLMQAPGESANKAAAGMELNQLVSRMAGVTKLFSTCFTVLTVAWGVLIVLALIEKVPARRTVLSLIFFLGAGAAAYELIAASYTPERCLCTTALLLITACGILLRELTDGRSRRVALCAAGALCAVFLFSFAGGAADVRNTRTQFTQRELSIQAQKQTGAQTVYVTNLEAETPYSPAYGLKDLDRANPDTWPNRFMAQYYGVDRMVWVNAEAAEKWMAEK